MDIARKPALPKPGNLPAFTIADALFALIAFGAAGYALHLYGHNMDLYEKTILACIAPATAALGWYWKPMRVFLPACAVVALLGIALYGGDLARAEQVFLLKFFLSSQTAITWMSATVFLATVAYWVGLLARSDFFGRCGTVLTWIAAGAGFVGLLVRWYESYLIGPDVGHIPVSNLYEVFVLFAVLTALMYLFYESRYATRNMGAFVMLVVSAAVGFLLWYSFSRDAYEIQPLIPALQSYWMKIHVPANFIGYGAFALAAMVGVAYLLVSKGVLAKRLPPLRVLDDVMYRAISIGFVFFTIATILGALWAAEAWGTYWQWDPKETWAFIVWVNYAAWLHMRLTKGLRGTVLAWWALIGLLVTTFAFLGVNMYLSGLHSYGSL